MILEKNNFLQKSMYIFKTTKATLPYIYMCGSVSVFGIRVRIHKAPE